MGSVSVSKVEELNKKIKDLAVKRNRVEAQTDMLKKRLSAEIAEYQKEFGVSLYGDTFEESMKLFEKEYAKVQQEIEEEYSFKDKIISLIDSGDIDGANALLQQADAGKVSSEEVTEEGLVEEGLVEEITEEDLTEEDLPAEVPEVSEPVGVLEDDDFMLSDLETEEIEEVFDLNEDGELEKATETIEEEVENGVLLDDTGVEEFVTEDFEVEDLEVEDDEDMGIGFEIDDDEDFGFGDLLKGSKLEI